MDIAYLGAAADKWGVPAALRLLAGFPFVALALVALVAVLLRGKST